jgi:hypothetical protein
MPVENLEAGRAKGRAGPKAHAKSTGKRRMKTIDASMNDLKAAIAAEIARQFPVGQRIKSVVGALQIEPDEARALISRGRRIARQKSKQERAA